MFSEISFDDKKVDMVMTEVGMVWKDNYRAKACLGCFPRGSDVWAAGSKIQEMQGPENNE